MIENLKEMIRQIRSTESARQQTVKENAEKVQPAKSPDNAGRISRFIAVVDQRRCAICGICVAICKEHAISLNESVVIDSYHCTACGSCIEACPNEAILLEVKDVDSAETAY